MSTCVIPVELSAKPTSLNRKERDDFYYSLNVYGAAAPAQFVAAALVDRDLTGSADPVAVALRPTLQAGRRTARLQRRIVYQFRHSRRGHHVGAVRGRLERDGSDYGYEPGRDGSPAGLADQPRGDYHGPDSFDVRCEHSSIAHPDHAGLRDRRSLRRRNLRRHRSVHLRNAVGRAIRRIVERAGARHAKAGIGNRRVELHPDAADVPFPDPYGQDRHARLDSVCLTIQPCKLERRGRARGAGRSYQLELRALAHRLPAGVRRYQRGAGHARLPRLPAFGVAIAGRDRFNLSVDLEMESESHPKFSISHFPFSVRGNPSDFSGYNGDRLSGREAQIERVRTAIFIQEFAYRFHAGSHRGGHTR